MGAATYQLPEAAMKSPVKTGDAGVMEAVFVRAASTFPLIAGQSLDMGVIPAGARILDAQLIFSAGATATSVDLGLYEVDDSGTQGDTDGLMDGINPSTNTNHRPDAVAELLGVLLLKDCYVRLTDETGNIGDTIKITAVVKYEWSPESGRK